MKDEILYQFQWTINTCWGSKKTFFKKSKVSSLFDFTLR